MLTKDIYEHMVSKVCTFYMATYDLTLDPKRFVLTAYTKFIPLNNANTCNEGVYLDYVIDDKRMLMFLDITRGFRPEYLSLELSLYAWRGELFSNELNKVNIKKLLSIEKLMTSL